MINRRYQQVSQRVGSTARAVACLAGHLGSVLGGVLIWAVASPAMAAAALEALTYVQTAKPNEAKASEPKASEPKASITVAQLGALAERVVVFKGLRTMRARIVSLDDREMRVVESLADEYDALLAGLPLDEEIASGGTQQLDPGLIVNFPRSDVLAIMPVTGAHAPAGLWAYAPGRGTNAVHRGKDANQRELKRLAELAAAENINQLRRRRGVMVDDDAVVPVAPGGTTPSVIPGTLALADGQVLSGSLVLVTGNVEPLSQAIAQDTVLWQSSLFAEGGRPVVVPLDRVRSIDVPNARSQIAVPVFSGSEDRIVLRNGDSLTGFASTSWLENTLRFGLAASDGVSTQVAGSRVRRVDIADDSQPRREGSMVWLADQTLLASNLAIEVDRSLLTWAGVAGAVGRETGPASIKPLRVTSSSIRAIAFARGRVSGLASLPVTATVCGDGRRWCPGVIVSNTSAAALGVEDIELPGPMEVTFALPANAKTLAAVIELPESCWEYGNCEVVMLVASKDGEGAAEELARVKLSSAQPHQPLRIDFASLPAASRGPINMIVRLDPTSDGPLQDRVLIRGALVESGEQTK